MSGDETTTTPEIQSPLWGKRYSGPHFAWILTIFGHDVEWTMVLGEPMRTACDAANAWPAALHMPLVFDTEAQIDAVLEKLRGA